MPHQSQPAFARNTAHDNTQKNSQTQLHSQRGGKINKTLHSPSEDEVITTNIF
jgi:hypothetical protein